MIDFIEEIFRSSIYVGIPASVACIFILLCRTVFKRISAEFYCSVWTILGLRLLVPIPIKDIFGLFDYVGIVLPIKSTSTLAVTDIAESVGNVSNSAANGSIAVADKNIQTIFSIIWLCGIVAMLLYMVISSLKIKHKTDCAIKIYDNIYACDNISIPFVFGFFVPRIYVPSNIDENTLSLVLLHENAHIKRKDYIRKPIMFLSLAFNWYNPFVWIAYHVFCCDTEASCDETAVSGNTAHKKDYLITLLNFSIGRNFNMTCPISLGKTGLRYRIRHISEFCVANKKHSVSKIILGVIVCGILLFPSCSSTAEKSIFTDDVDTVNYVCKTNNDIAEIILNKDENSFDFSVSALSSSIFTGKYKIKDDTLILTDEGGEQYFFEITDSTLIFDKSKSGEVPEFVYSDNDSETECCLNDGDVFVKEAEE